MSYSRDPQVGVRQAPPETKEIPQAGPISTYSPATGVPKGYGARGARRVAARSKLERAGFWLIVVAAFALLFVLAGVILPPLFNGLIAGTFTGAFVGLLTLMNLSRPSGWANAVLGRRTFPVLHADEGEVWRLAGVNASLTFVFSFFFYALAHTLIGPFLAGIIVFGGLIAAGIFYTRARKVIIKP